jgi:hypothetical protein
MTYALRFAWRRQSPEVEVKTAQAGRPDDSAERLGAGG